MQERITNDEIKNIVLELQIQGHDISVRDIAYVFLRRVFDSKNAVYKVTSDSRNMSEDFITEYDSSAKIAALTKFIDKTYPEDTANVQTDEGLSFDEIKRGLEEDLMSLISLRDKVDENGEPFLDAKEKSNVIGRIADIRVKLTEKFGTTVQSEEQRVVVLQKFNDICPYCRHEIAVRR